MTEKHGSGWENRSSAHHPTPDRLTTLTFGAMPLSPLSTTWTLDDLLASPMVKDDPLLVDRITRAAWTCPHCGIVVPALYHGSQHIVVRRVHCMCGPEPLCEHENREKEEQRRIASDRYRTQAIFGGTHPGAIAWLKRFETFERAIQPEGYDALLGWCIFIGRVYDETGVTQRRDDPNQLLDVRQRWIEALRRIPSLMLTGPAHSGKTHLLLACLHHLCSQSDYTHQMGINMLFLPGLAYLDAIRQTWDQPEGVEESLVARAGSVGILLVDGIDARCSEWAAGRWQRILEDRSLRGYPTVVSGASIKTLTSALGNDVYASLYDHAVHVSLKPSSRPKQTMLAVKDLQRLGRETTLQLVPANVAPRRIVEADLPSGDDRAH